jgi:hypothetical protein
MLVWRLLVPNPNPAAPQRHYQLLEAHNVDEEARGEVVIIVGEEVGMGEHHPHMDAVVATDVEHSGVKTAEEADLQPTSMCQQLHVIHAVDLTMVISHIKECVRRFIGDPPCREGPDVKGVIVLQAWWVEKLF